MTTQLKEAGTGSRVDGTPAVARKLRVVAMVNNPCVVDARVIREATALAEAGFEVHVLAHTDPDVPAEERVDGVSYHRIPVRAKQRRALADSNGEEKTGREERARFGGDWSRKMWAPVAKLSRKTGSSIRGVLKAIYRLLRSLWPFGERAAIKSAQFWFGVRSLWSEVRLRFRRLAAKCVRRLSSLARTAIGLVTLAIRQVVKVARFVVTGTGAELLRHARAYHHPAVALKPDVVHAHDLYTLLAGYLVAKRTGAKLVYDSHELEVGRNGNFSRWELLLRAQSEKYLIKKTDAVITVCDSIADYLRDLYGIERPTVVHNAPSIQTMKSGAPDVRSQLGLSKNVPIALYVGSVTINRGLEHCVRALSHADGVHLVCVGPRHKPTEESILEEAVELGVEDRLHLVDPVPHDEVTSFVRSSDVSLITIQDVCLSYRFCFPNKLLESLLTGLPIVVSRLVELERIVEMTGAGVVVDETDPADIARGIRQILSERQRFVPGPEVVRTLKETYSLEVQMEKLLALYHRLLPSPVAN